MSKFIETKKGYVNLDHVVKMQLNALCDGFVIYLSDGGTDTATVKDVEKAPLWPIYQAQQGTEVLCLFRYYDDGEWFIFTEKHSVMAWRSDEQGLLTPITATKPYLSSDDRWVLIIPDVGYWDLSDHTFYADLSGNEHDMIAEVTKSAETNHA